MRFEVASIRPHTDMHSFVEPLTVSNNRITLMGYTLGDLVMEAYNLPSYGFSISPASRRSDATYNTSYDVVANAEGTQPPSRENIRAMLQTLLADRFNLRTHTQLRELPVYNLVVMKSGPKFKPSSPEEANGKTSGRVTKNGRNQILEVVNENMLQLANNIAVNYGVSLPIIDKTGLTETYDLKLEATRGAYICDDSQPEDLSIFTALQHQLGLKLVPARASLSVLVVDHAELPSAN